MGCFDGTALFRLSQHLNWLKFKVRAENPVFSSFLQHPTSLKLEVMNNVLTQFCMNSSFGDCKVFPEHFPRSVPFRSGTSRWLWVNMRQFF